MPVTEQSGAVADLAAETDLVVETDPAVETDRYRSILADRVEDSIRLRQRLLIDDVLDDVAAATRVLVAAARRRSTIFFFGNGGSSADAGHLAAELLGRFYRDRAPLPAIALADTTAAMTAIGNDYGYEQVFARQLAALGRPGDAAVGITTSGNSPNVVRAFEVARELGITTIALTGGAGGKVAEVADHVIRVPSEDTPRIQECHVLLGHTMCELVELEMFPEGDL